METSGREAAALEALERLALADRSEGIERALDAAREMLGMDIAYFSEIAHGDQVIKQVRGDRDAVGISPDDEIPLEETYCKRMLAGELPSLIPDAQNDPRVSDMPATAESGIGSYAGVPLQLSDGRVYGTLCCASGSAMPQLGRRDVQFMHVLARMIADSLERDEDRLPRSREGAQPPPPTPAEAAREAAQVWEDEMVLKLDLWFAAAAHAAGAARSALEVLAEHVGRSLLHDARLLVTELVTNSVRHAGVGRESAVGLALRLTPGRLTVAISDPGPGFQPQISEPSLDDEGGRGLFIVDHLADRWGVGGSPLSPPGHEDRLEPGTIVWFELERRDAAMGAEAA